MQILFQLFRINLFNYFAKQSSILLDTLLTPKSLVGVGRKKNEIYLWVQKRGIENIVGTK